MKHWWILLCITLVSCNVQGETLNGFELTNPQINTEDIKRGGPPKDGIPAITSPKFVSIDEVDFLDDQDLVVVVEFDDVKKVYPISILNWHEIVLDMVGNQPVMVSFCPLCGTAMVFDRKVEGKQLDFGVSGLLYQSDMLIYDKQTQSLWSQIEGKAVTGSQAGNELLLLNSQHMNYGDYVEQNPDALVLSTKTGYARDYQRNPYQGYEQSMDLYFPVNHEAPKSLHRKEEVAGIKLLLDSGKTVWRAYARKDVEGKNISEEYEGKTINLLWQKNGELTLTVDGKKTQPITGFWFAWFSFHPETSLYALK